MVKQFFKNERGAITLFVLLSMLFFLIIVLSMFMRSSNKQQSESAEIDKIKEEYAQSVKNIDEIYAQATAPVVPIPDGFYHVEGTTVDTGFVISDEKDDNLDNVKGGNQFVWVPVENYDEFIRKSGYFNGREQTLLSNYGEVDSTGNNSNTQVTESAITQTEAQEMYASVRDNGGFYIGRYEAGKDGNNQLVVKKGATVYNNIPWSSNGSMEETDGTTGGAIELARNFDTANGYTDVTSTLIYGVQWDAVMTWLENIENPNLSGTLTKYIQDSTGMGWYKDNGYSPSYSNSRAGFRIALYLK